MHNTIILTSGLTGSSVLTGFLARGGFWAGGRTAQKKDYNTFENEELVQFNLELFQRGHFEANYQTNFSPQAIERVTALARDIDLDPYREFMRKCEAHRPFVWKDPRLWMTIRFWNQAVDLKQCRFLLLTREFFQCWVSTTSRRIIQSYGRTKAYEQSVRQSATAFVEENRLPYLHVTYEGLIAEPEKNIALLNEFLEAKLTVEHLASVYRGPLHRRPASSASGVAKAVLIYLKNYSERADVKDPLPMSR